MDSRILKIEKEILECIKDLLSEYNLKLEIGNLEEHRFLKEQIYIRYLFYKYESEYYKTRLEDSIKYIVKNDWIHVVVYGKTIARFKNKATLNDKAKAKIKDLLRPFIENFVSECKRVENLIKTKAKIIKYIKDLAGLDLNPAVYIAGKYFTLKLEDKFFIITMEGKVEDVVKINSITIKLNYNTQPPDNYLDLFVRNILNTYIMYNLL